MLRKILSLLLFAFSVLSGCAPFSEVHKFATSSAEALNKINEVDYTFKDYCHQDCELQQLRLGEIKPFFNCNCEEAATNADTAVQKIHHTITAYLQAVAQLSNNSDFSYDVSGLTQALQKSTLLQMTEKQMGITTKAGNFIATAATSFYRKKKLKQYLGQADTIFQDLTETFIYLIDNRLRAQLKFEYDTRVPNIKQMVDNTSDKGARQVFVKLYLDEKAYYDRHNMLLDKYVALLKLVQKGYHELYIHRYNLKDDGIKDLTKHYSEDLQYIVSSLK